MVIGWNGLSIHAQVASMISRTDIRYLPYFFARILHGFLAGIITLVIYPLMAPHLHQLPAIRPVMASVSAAVLPPWWEGLQWLSLLVSLFWLFRFFRGLKTRH
jgi:nucleoside recognition membrane protein YjiH